MRTNPAGFQNPHSRANRVARLAWQAVLLLLFRPSPWFMTGWRAWLLRRFGARLGRDVRVHPSVGVWAPWLLEAGDEVYIDMRVNLYNPYGIRIGSRVIISQGAFLCSASHDHRQAAYPLIGGKIDVGDDCWIAAEAFIGPGITVHTGAVVGARATVVRDVAEWTVVGGNPAKAIKARAIDSANPT